MFHVLQHPERITYILFADNAERLRAVLDEVIGAKLHFDYIVVKEDFAHSLLLMTLCDHHIGSTSAFSFWGAYLDKKQPNNGGLSIFPQQYEMRHKARLPFKHWYVMRSESLQSELREHGVEL